MRRGGLLIRRPVGLGFFATCPYAPSQHEHSASCSGQSSRQCMHVCAMFKPDVRWMRCMDWLRKHHCWASFLKGVSKFVCSVRNDRYGIRAKKQTARKRFICALGLAGFLRLELVDEPADSIANLASWQWTPYVPEVLGVWHLALGVPWACRSHAWEPLDSRAGVYG